MARLIDVDVAIERAKQSDKIVRSSIWETGEVVEFLEDEPTVDAVEVVRCKDCVWRKKWVKNGTHYCSNPNYGMAVAVELLDNDFCSYGERRRQ